LITTSAQPDRKRDMKLELFKKRYGLPGLGKETVQQLLIFLDCPCCVEKKLLKIREF
jgi:hypothetical protein